MNDDHGIFSLWNAFCIATGSNPKYLSQDSDGNLYGTTSAYNGTIFRITMAGALTTLHSFNYSLEGSQPTNLIHGADGNFYGTNVAGGLGSGGTVFEMTPDGTLSTLHAFTGAADG